MKRSPLPDGVTGPFSVAAARDAGVPASRLRASDLRTPFRGVRTLHTDTSDDARASVRRRVREYAEVMPASQFFCLATACVLWGGPIPPGLLRHRDGAGGLVERPLDVGVFLPDRASRTQGVRGRSIAPGWAEVVTAPVDGIRLTSPASTWAMMGQVLSEDELVILGDALVRMPERDADPPPLATIDDLRRAVEVGRRPGVLRIREALPLVRTRAWSPQETRTRLVLVRDGGLPEPELNWPVLVGGHLVANIDLAYPDFLLGFEYDGEHHMTDAEQWAKDIRRAEMLADLGWSIMRVTKRDLDTLRGPFIARVRSRVLGAVRRHSM
ncbi:hypothetical protein [Microbacterium aurantiacum]|uniref:hypothetical protein n=1 Tax=Microbacterium aurantiacum TaxID=162393 RepID=UPI001F35AD0B|nr:hypothetical protein [Microbacterium aurantiacum]